MKRFTEVIVFLFLALMLSCKPRPEPQPADPDSVAVDTIPEITPQDTVHELLTPRRGIGVASGIPVGVTGFLPEDNWCSGPLSGTTVTVMPNLLGPLLRKAAQCGFIVFIVPPRKLYTTNGYPIGTFSLANAKSAILAYKKAAGDTLLVRYKKVFGGLYAGDDMPSKVAWPPNGISCEQMAALTNFAKAIFGSDVPIGLRVGPDWMATCASSWHNSVDFTVWQWHKGKPLGQIAMYDKWKSLMPKVGVAKAIVTFNYKNCDGVSDAHHYRYCSANEIGTFLTNALNYDGSINCGSIGWTYTSALSGDRLTEVKKGVALGRTKTGRTCGR